MDNNIIAGNGKSRKAIMGKQFLYALLLCLCAQGCAEAIEKDLSKKQVTLTAPSDQVVVPDSSALTFAWDSLEGAIRYKLQVVSPSFDSIVQLYADTTVTGFFYTLPLLTVRGRYQWRVMGLNNTTVSEYSVPWNFTVQ
jgi:hypothetical protein